MPIRPEFLVRGLDGRPQPPQDLLERIRRYDSRLGLFYTNAAWAITEAWREDDQRRQWIQSGEVQPEAAFDICGYLPITCSLDEAPAYIEQMLRSYTLDQYTALRQAVTHWNEFGLLDQVGDKVMAEVSNALDKSNDVSPGISEAVAIDLKPKAPAAADPAIAAVMAPFRRRKKAG